MTRSRKLLFSLLVFGLAGAAAGGAAFSAFVSQTTNSGNAFSAGTVSVTDDDAAGALVTLPATARPGDSNTGCIQVTYTGSLPASMRLHATATGTLPQYLTLTVTRGTQTSASFPSCTSFTADTGNYGYGANGIVYQGALSSYPSTWAAGIVDPDSSWTSTEQRSYRFQITLGSNAAAQGLSSGAIFHWEARNT